MNRWTKLEIQNNQFNWSYYIRVFDMIISNGLDIIPIMSTACETNIRPSFG